MDRIKFANGKQKVFLNLVIGRLNAVSLRGILQFGFNIPYSTLKNYYNEYRLLPKNLFEDLCLVAKIDSSKIDYEVVKGSWGQVKGGSISKRGKSRSEKKEKSVSPMSFLNPKISRNIKVGLCPTCS